MLLSFPRAQPRKNIIFFQSLKIASNLTAPKIQLKLSQKSDASLIFPLRSMTPPSQKGRGVWGYPVQDPPSGTIVSNSMPYKIHHHQVFWISDLCVSPNHPPPGIGNAPPYPSPGASPHKDDELQRHRLGTVDRVRGFPEFQIFG